jgi:hypothetical protein
LPRTAGLECGAKIGTPTAKAGRLVPLPEFPPGGYGDGLALLDISTTSAPGSTGIGDQVGYGD